MLFRFMAKTNNKRVRKSGLKRWKTFSEKEVLECYFVLDPNWTRKTIAYVTKLVRLTEDQIYKWGYERKRKDKSHQSEFDENIINTNRRTNTQSSTNASDDYNNLVNELFPMDLDSTDKLSKDEKSLYNKVRDQLLIKDDQFKGMSELDRLLCERIKLSDIVQYVRNLTKMNSEVLAPISNLHENSEYNFDFILNQSTCKDDTNSFALNCAKRREIKENNKIENNYFEFESFIWSNQNETIKNRLGFRNRASIFNEIYQTNEIILIEHNFNMS